jgi:hypothetical protein
MSEVRFTWGQLKLIAEGLGLADEDPEPSPPMLIAMFEARRIIDTEYDRLKHGFDPGGDGK